MGKCAGCKQNLTEVGAKCMECNALFHLCCCNRKHRIVGSDGKLIVCNGQVMPLEVNDDNMSVVSTDSRRSKRRRGEIEDDDVEVGDELDINEKIDSILDNLSSIMREQVDFGLEMKKMLQSELSVFKKQIESSVMTSVKKELQDLKSYMNKNFVKNDSSVAAGEKGKENSQTKQSTTYACMVAKSRVENVIIIPKDNQDNEKTLSEVKKCASVCKLAVGIEKMNATKKGAVIVGCSTASQKQKLAEEIKKNIGENYEVKIPEKKLPKVKIVSVDKEVMELSDDEVIHAVIGQNEIISTPDTKIFVRNKFVKSGKGFGTITLEVDPVTHKLLLSKEKISVGWNKCRVFDYVPVLQCYKCWGYHHFAKDCKSEVVCRKCAGKHEEKSCNSNFLKCVNCVKMIDEFKLKNIDERHYAIDENCAYHKKMVQRVQRNTLYSDQ